MGEYHKIARMGDVAPGEVGVYELEGHRVALCNVDGAFHAIEDVCTHDAGPLDQGELIGNQIRCPRHGAKFDVTTGKFVIASEDAVLAGENVGRHLQTYSRKDIGPRVGFAYDIDGRGTMLVRGGFGIFWNFSPGGTSSSKAQNPCHRAAETASQKPDRAASIDTP